MFTFHPRTVSSLFFVRVPGPGADGPKNGGSLVG
jgi:hypothetical protein